MRLFSSSSLFFPFLFLLLHQEIVCSHPWELRKGKEWKEVKKRHKKSRKFVQGGEEQVVCRLEEQRLVRWDYWAEWAARGRCVITPTNNCKRKLSGRSTWITANNYLAAGDSHTLATALPPPVTLTPGRQCSSRCSSVSRSNYKGGLVEESLYCCQCGGFMLSRVVVCIENTWTSLPVVVYIENTWFASRDKLWWS